MNRYKIMSFNLKNSGVPAAFHRRADAIKQVMLKYKPDIVAVQEFGNFMYRDLNSLNNMYQWVLYGRGKTNKKGEECGFLVKKGSFDQVRCQVYWLSDTPAMPGSKFKNSMFPRIVVIGEFTDAKNTFYVADTHLDHLLEPVRLRQSVVLANILNEHYPSDRMIVTGDFNAPRKASCIKTLKDMTGMEEMVAENDGPSVREIPGFSMRKDPIDHFFCKKGIQVINNRILTDKFDGIYPSDHYLLCCEIELK